MNKLTKKKNFCAGFTLVELIVIVGIIGVLTVIVFLLPRNNIDINLAARDMVSDLRWVQNAAMIGYDPPGNDDVYGYGAHIKSDGSGYILYYTDTDPENNVTYEDDGNPDDYPIRSIDFPGGITVTNAQAINADIFYYSPDPTTVITPSPAAGELTITLAADGESADIIVNTTGLIDY